jgi:hypothetical protein
MAKVLDVIQLPSFVAKGRLDWDLRDEECNIQMKHRKDGWKITGQWVTWKEGEGDDEGDWESKDMTTEEAMQMMKKFKLVDLTGSLAIKLLG